MDNLNFTTLQKGQTMVSDVALDTFAAGFRGNLLTSGDVAYDEARAIWNAMIDRRPGLIARCAGAADVIRTVRFARDNNLLISVRGGGHGIAGNAVCEGGVIIDLSPMKSVRVDPETRRARIEPGATLGDVDKETMAFGLVLRPVSTLRPGLPA